MVNCNFRFTISLHKYSIHLVLCLYKDPNQGSHLYKEHVNLYIYHNAISNFSSIVYIIFSPLTTRKIENDMVLIAMSIEHFLIIWESNDLCVMSSLRPL